MLAQQRLADGDRIELADVGADRQPVDRRRGDQRQLAHAGERELQGARDRGGGQRQDVDVRAQRLQPLLVGDAEVLLLVDDQQAEIPELHRLRQQRVGADDDLDAAVRQPRARLGRLLGAHEARKLADAERQAAEPFGEVLEVLAGEQRGRRDHRHLIARRRRDVGGAQRDLGLAEADVAADQPVHRPARLHVAEHVGDGVQLVLGLGIGEAGAELLPGVVVLRLQHRALAQRAFGGDADQPVGHVADPRLQPGLLRLPRPAAEPVEQALLVAVARQELDVLDRQVEPVAAGVLQRQALVRRAHRGDGLEPLVAPDAVVDVDHQIARREAGRLGQEVVGALAPAGRADQPVAQHVLLGDHRQPRRLEAVLERPDRQREALVAGEVGGLADLAGVGHAAVGEQARQPFPRAGGVAGDHHVAGAPPRRHVGGQRPEQAHLLLLPLRREVAADPPARVDHPGPERLRQDAELVQRAVGHRRLPGRVVEVELARRHRLVDGAELRFRRQRRGPGLVLFAERGPARRPRRGRLVVEQHRRPRQVVEQRREPLVEERQPVLVALQLAARADRLVERIVVARRAEHRPVAGAEPLDRRLVEDHLGDRRELNPPDRLAGALGLGIEPPGALEHVAEEIEPHRPARAGRIDVDEPAAHRELAGLGDGGRLAVAHPRRGSRARRRHRRERRPSR